MSRTECTAVYCWSCGNGDRTSDDQDEIGRPAELITKVMETDNCGKSGKEGKESTDDDDLEEFEEVPVES